MKQKEEPKGRFFRVFDTAGSATLGVYKRRGNAERKRKAELETRNLPGYFIVVMEENN